MDDIAMMREALALAQAAADDGEVPVGCVVAMPDGRIVGRGRNRREKGRSALAHAELEAIGEACRTLGGWRPWQCTLYVTLEPCCMCAGAITGAQIPRVVYGAKDPKMGAGGSGCGTFCRHVRLPSRCSPRRYRPAPAPRPAHSPLRRIRVRGPRFRKS